MFKKIKNQEGQVAVFVVLIFPLFILLMACFVNIGLLVHQKIRLQTATDAAIYSGSASLARDLNRITVLNENINELYQGDPTNPDLEVQWEKSLKDTLENESFNDRDIAEWYFDEYQQMYHQILDIIDDINESALSKATAIAKQAALLTYYNGNTGLKESNPNQLVFENLYDNNSGLMIEYKQNTTIETASYIEVKKAGGDFTSPEGYCEDCVVREVNLPIEKISKVIFAGKTSAKVGFVNIWPEKFYVNQSGENLELTTYAAGQPYGGEVISFADTYRATLIKIGNYVEDYPNGFWH